MEYAHEVNSVIQTKDIIVFLITLYAIVPSIIITMMYTFLSSTEAELSNIVTADIKKAHMDIRAKKIKKFIIGSSKMFHLGMTYYLILLCSALATQAFKLFEYSLMLLIIATTIYIVYFILYLLKDIRKSVRRVYDDSYAEKYCYYFIIMLVYGAFPILIPSFYYAYGLREETYLHLGWITLTIAQLLIWWMYFPFKYRPLTHLSYIKKSINDLKPSSI